MKPSKIVAFDLDHTLLNNNVSWKFGCFLCRERKCPYYKLFPICIAYLMKLRGWISMEALHKTAFHMLFKGRAEQEIHGLVQDFLASCSMDDFYYLPVLNRLKEAQERGDHVVILSASPEFLVSAIAKQLEVQDLEASEYCVDSRGRYFSIKNIVTGDQKAHFIQSLMNTYNLPRSATIAYSDSIDDIDLLNAAGTPVAVKPDSFLQPICIANGWQII